jgi:hypothetical protein
MHLRIDQPELYIEVVGLLMRDVTVKVAIPPYQRRLNRSVFFAVNSSSVRMFFCRSSARLSMILNISLAEDGAVVAPSSAGRQLVLSPPWFPQFALAPEARTAGDSSALSGRGENERQVRDTHETHLAPEGQRLVAALLLGKA